MKTSFGTMGLCALLAAAATAACGSSGSSDSGPSGGAAGASAAGASTAGAAAAGASAAGANTAGAGGAPAGAGASSQGGSPSNGGAPVGGGICSPGMSYKTVFAYPDPLMNCGFTGTGELAGVAGLYRSIKLPAPLGPGQTFAFSVGAGTLGSGTMELWGGTGECGEAHEHLSTVSIGPNAAGTTFCMAGAPKTGTYPYLIWVWHTAGEHGDVTLCPNVSCPAQ